MHHVWSVICSSSSIDIHSNNISLFNVLEKVKFNIEEKQEKIVREQNEHNELGLPITIEIVSMWWRSEIDTPEDGESRLVLITPDKKRFDLGEAKINLIEYTKVRSMGQLTGVPFTISGIYYFEVSKKFSDDWEVVAKIPVEIIQETLSD